MAESGGIISLIARAVVLLHSDKLYGPRLSSRWLPAAAWAELLVKSGHIDPTIVSIVDARKFNTAMSKSILFGESMTRFDGTNQSGMFRVCYQKQFFYYFTEKKRQVYYPFPLDKAWKERAEQAAVNALSIPLTRGRPPAAESTQTTSDNQEVPENNDLQPTIGDISEPPNKLQRTDSSVGGGISSTSCSYWPSSPEAYYLFKPRAGTGETPQEAVERRIQLLQSVHKHEDSWRNVIVGRDADHFCTKAEIVEIRQRATFLCCAYQLALEHMNRWTWQDCCREACKRLNSLGMSQATFYKTVSEWNGVFRSLESFPHPNLYVQCGKRPLPRLLEMYPDARDQIVSFGVKNLATLTIEGIHNFIVSVVIPRLATVWKEDQQKVLATADNSTSTAAAAILSQEDKHDNKNKELLTASFLKAHGLESMSFTTAWRWMQLLNFKYDARKKSFYVDGHERDDVVQNRKEFCKQYLTELEPYCRRWVQVSKEDAMTMNGLDLRLGHSYFDIVNDTEMFEFHIDYWKYCTKKNGPTNPPFTTTLHPTTSIRVSLRATPLMIIGQDESVFAQYLLGNRTWIGPSGQRPLLPKSEGDGYMLSAFVSREFGFGRVLTKEELDQVNAARRAVGRNTYVDKHAAKEVLGTINKSDLKESPLVKYLYIGASNEGYWNSFHMSVQFEDVVDCLQVLYPEFQFVFLFDHSQGHARKRDGALTALSMSKGYGGAQAKMRDTIILQDEGYLGPHSPILKAGDTQSLVYLESDSGPWYLSPEQRQSQRHDRPTGRSKRVERSKKILVECLRAAGVTLQQQRGYTRKELQEFAKNNGIDLHEQKEVVTFGWERQPKGLLQVLWERGLIDCEAIDKYTVDGRKDIISGKVDLQYSLRGIMSNCRDFKEEETALQHLGRQLGVTVMLTPKFHAELAGEGVEYSWAHAKAFYRRLPVSRKRGRDNFKQLVKESTCPANVLTKIRIEKFASRARAYICTYHHIEEEKNKRSNPVADIVEEHATRTAVLPGGGDDAVPNPMHQQLHFTKIERISKAFKGHRCALDFDSGFVNSEFREVIEINDEM
jgi:hypothetical protein